MITVQDNMICSYGHTREHICGCVNVYDAPLSPYFFTIPIIFQLLGSISIILVVSSINTSFDA